MSNNTQLSEDTGNLIRLAKKAQRRQRIRDILTRKGRHNFSALAAVVFVVVSVASIGYAFFSDVFVDIGSAKAGCLQDTPTVAIDGTNGNQLANVTSRATCVSGGGYTTSDVANAACDNLPCNGQYQGDTGVTIAPNTIHDFSFDFANTGTINLQNYIGDTVGGWLNDPDGYVVPLPQNVGVKFDGTDYINTGIRASNNVVITADAQYNASTLNSYLFGERDCTTTGCYTNSMMFGISNSGAWIYYYAGGTASPGAMDSNRNTIVMNGNGKHSINGNVTTISATTFASTATIALGGFNGAGSVGALFSGVVYGFSIIDSGALVANYQPAAHVASDGTVVYGFWDTVLGKFIAPTAGNPFTMSVGGSVSTPLNLSTGTITQAATYSAASQILANQGYSGGNAVDLIGRGSYAGTQLSCLTASNYIPCVGQPTIAFSLDLTNVQTVTFWAKKVTNHGGIQIRLDDPSSSAANVLLASYSYGSLTAGQWVQYSVNVSSLTGTHTLYFSGGYVDATGNTNSETMFSDIALVSVATAPQPLNLGPRLVLYPQNTPDATIASEITAALAITDGGGSPTFASASCVATIGSPTDLLFRDDNSDTGCQHPTADHIGDQNAVGHTNSYDGYKFVLFVPNSVIVSTLANMTVNMGVASGAQNIVASATGNWKQQVRPWVSANLGVISAPTLASMTAIEGQSATNTIDLTPIYSDTSSSSDKLYYVAVDSADGYVPASASDLINFVLNGTDPNLTNANYAGAHIARGIVDLSGSGNTYSLTGLEEGIAGDAGIVGGVKYQIYAVVVDDASMSLLASNVANLASPVLAQGFDGGFGTAANPYQIANGTELSHMNYSVYNTNASLNYQIQNNIDLSSFANWIPIGSATTPFVGTFDGQGFAISNLMMTNATATEVGLFGASKGIIENTGIANGSVASTNATASKVGGLIGWVEGGSVTNCYSGASVSAAAGTDGSNGAGGLIGTISGGTSASPIIISHSHATGTVFGAQDVGGFLGDIQPSTYVTISTSYATGNVTGGAGYQIGGFIGRTNGNTTITNSYATGTVTSNGTGQHERTGGFAGWIQDSTTLTYCYASGNVVSNSTNGSNNAAGIGGFIGSTGGTGSIVRNCLALNTSVSSPAALNAKTGKFIGYNSGITFGYSWANSVMTTNGTAAQPGGTYQAQPNSAILLTSFFANTANWYNGVVWDATVWNLANGVLPTLK